MGLRQLCERVEAHLEHLFELAVASNGGLLGGRWLSFVLPPEDLKHQLITYLNYIDLIFEINSIFLNAN